MGGWAMKRSEKSSAPAAGSPVGTSAPACAHLRDAYHNCFNRWYAEQFVKGRWDKDDCAAQWLLYRDCLRQHLDDKHLRQILLDSDVSSSSTNEDANAMPEDLSSR